MVLDCLLRGGHAKAELTAITPLPRSSCSIMDFYLIVRSFTTPRTSVQTSFLGSEDAWYSKGRSALRRVVYPAAQSWAWLYCFTLQRVTMGSVVLSMITGQLRVRNPEKEHLAIVGYHKLWTRNGERRVVRSSYIIAHAAMMVLTKFYAVCLVKSIVARR